MLTVSPIKNVQSTINNISFKSGVQSNHGSQLVATSDVKHEGSFITDFLGTIKYSPLFFETLRERQTSIEKGLQSEQRKINAIA